MIEVVLKFVILLVGMYMAIGAIFAIIDLMMFFEEKFGKRFANFLAISLLASVGTYLIWYL